MLSRYNLIMKSFDWRRGLLSLTGLKRLIRQPRYVVLSFAVAFLFSIVIYGLIHINFYGSLLLSSLPIVDKLALIGQLIAALARDAFTTSASFLIILISLLQGVAIAAIVFDAKHNRANNKQLASRQTATSGIAALAAALGLGCVPCGTSLILPIVTLFFSGAAATTAAHIANSLVLIVALCLSIWSLARSGYIVYIHTELTQQKESHA